MLELRSGTEQREVHSDLREQPVQRACGSRSVAADAAPGTGLGPARRAHVWPELSSSSAFPGLLQCGLSRHFILQTRFFLKSFIET